MSNGRTQLNINIDPKLLLRLKSEAIKNGKTLTQYVTDQLKGVPQSSSPSSLEERLSSLEKVIFHDNQKSELKKTRGSIFTDKGAAEYGRVAKAEFDSFRKKKGLTTNAALMELDQHLKNYPHSNPELIFQILLGTHDLTGFEMTNAYRHGSCAMRSALNDWTKDSLEKLNQAFLQAVVTKDLAHENR